MAHIRIRDALGRLENQPLVEAIFEVSWSLEGISPSDELWDILPGLYYGAVSQDYPHMEALSPAKVPAYLTPGMIRHRFRRAKGAWPVTQIGPGILSVNQTTEYSEWEDFLPRITGAVDSLVKVCPQRLQFTRIELRYINAVPFDEAEQSIIGFLSDKLHISVDLPTLFDGEAETNEAINANVTFHIPSKNPKGVAEVTVCRGTHNGEDAVVFHFIVRSHGHDAPQDQISLSTWAERAHVVIDRWFLKLCDGDLLESFKGTPHIESK